MAGKTEKLIIDLSVTGIQGGKQQLDDVKNSISNIKKEIDKFSGKDDIWSTQQLEKYKKELTLLTQNEIALTKAVSAAEIEMTKATNATTSLTTAQQRAANQAKNTAQSMTSAFGIVGQTMQTMGSVTDSAFRTFANQQFPKWGDLSKKELSILQSSYQQAAQIGTQSLDMQSLAMVAFKGDVNETALAVSSYQKLMANNVGADNITTTTAALVALKTQLIAGGYNAKALNQELANMSTANITGGFENASKSTKELEKDVYNLVSVLKNSYKSLDIGGGDVIHLLPPDYEEEINKAANSAKTLSVILEDLNEKMDEAVDPNKTDLTKPFSKINAGFLSSLAGMTQRLTLMREQMRLLSEEERTGEFGQNLSKNINDLNNQLEKAEKATATMGTAARQAKQVGYDPLNNSIMQIARELPNFAISARIGIMAISNNLPILVDEIKKVTDANKALKKSNEEALAAGRTQDVEAYKSIWKQIGSSILSFNTIVIGGTILLTAYGEAVWKWAKALLVGKDYVYNLSLANQAMVDTLTSSTSAAASNVKKIAELGAAINKYRENSLSKSQQEQTAIKIVEDYNNTLGVHYGKLKTINEVLLEYNKNAKKYIEWTIAMTASTKLADEAAEQLLRGKAVERKMGSMGISPEMQASIKNSFDGALKAREDYYIKEMQKDAGRVLSEKEIFNARIAARTKFFDQMSETENIFSDNNFERLNLEKKVKLGVNETELKEYVKLLRDKEIANNIYQNKLNAAVKLFPGDVSTAKPTATGTKTTTGKAGMPGSPTIPIEEAYVTQYLTLYKNRLNTVTKMTNEEKVVSDYSYKNQTDAFTDSISNQRKYNVDLQNARLQDSKNALENAKTEIDLKTWAIKKNEERAWDKIRVLNVVGETEVKLVKDFNKIIYDEEKKIYDEEIKLVNLRNTNQKDFTDAQKETLTKQITNQQEMVDKTKKISEPLIAYYKNLRTESQKIIDSASVEAKKISDDLQSTNGKTTEEVNALRESLKGLNATIEANQNIVNTQKKNQWLQGLEDAAVAAEKLNGILKVGSQVMEVGMTWTNRKFDNEKRRLEESNEYNQASSEQQEQMMFDLEVKRYEALKTNFENKKKFDMGVVAIEAISAEMMAVKNLIANGGVISPWAWAAFAAETLTIGVSAAANISEINSRQLDAPVKPKSKSGVSGGGGGSMNSGALNPNKNAMTSSQENLNMMQNSSKSTESTTVVKVTDINKVQNNVKVRENNSSY